MDVVLDYEKNIRMDIERPRLLHAHAIETHKLGLHHLAKQVREHEQHYIDRSEFASVGSEVMEDFGYFEPVVYCAFNWFAITLTSYLRLIALVDLMNRHQWSLKDLVSNERSIAKACSDYVSDIALGFYPVFADG